MSEARVGPLKIWSDDPRIITDENDFEITGCWAEGSSSHEDEQIARRLVAAWNATRIFRVEDLESGVVGEMIAALMAVSSWYRFSEGEAEGFPIKAVVDILLKVLPEAPK